MKNLSITLFVTLLLVGCGSVPKPKQPNESNLQPINKTMPAELKGATK